jgi:hypothetical protein
VSTPVRRSELPDQWPGDFHPLMRMGRRPQPRHGTATAPANSWWGLSHDLATADVEAREDALADYARGREAFTSSPTTLAPPPGGPPEVQARHELAGVPPDAFAIGYELAVAQHRKGPASVREMGADFITTGTLALATAGQPVQLVGADPFRRRLLVTAVGQVWLVGPNTPQVQDVGGGIASSGLLINGNTANPLPLRTTGAVYVWAAFAGATVTWLAEVYKSTDTD